MGDFEDYEDSVGRYGATWFRRDTDALDVCQQVPRVRREADRISVAGGTVGTQVIFRVGGEWIGSRVAVHERVIADTMQSSEAPLGPSEKRRAADGRWPHAILLLGLPGSGKTSMLRRVAYEVFARVLQDEHAIVDADVVRTLLPQYAGGLGSEVVQVETSYLANGPLLDDAYARRFGLVLDKIGDPFESVEVAERLIATGWSVWCLCAHVDVEVAVERVRRRAIETGRYVPPAFVRDVADRPVRAYEALRASGLTSGCSLLDTDVEVGQRPVVLDAYTPEVFGDVGEPVAVWRGDANGGEGEA